jgi:formate-dependent nitrite reductase membrane component NrfD
MNYWVADPEWGWWLILYFYLGGIAAGAYFMATLVELFGSEEDRELPRIGYWLTFPLILLCSVFLIVDLHLPGRFWHMLFKSEVMDDALAAGWPTSGQGWNLFWRTPILKVWSPMSIGSWALSVLGFCSGLSFLGSFSSDGILVRILRRGIIGRALQIVGSIAGFFVAAYTGSLLTATNQPLWSDSVWIAPLFLTSAASTSIAAILLIARWHPIGSVATLHRLENADLWALCLELIVFAAFLASLGENLLPVMGTLNGKLFLIGTLLVGLLLPLAIHLRLGMDGRWSLPAAAACALLGGFILRYGILKTPPELLERGPAVAASFSPEDGRRPGQRGADPGNERKDFSPRTKVTEK